MIRSVKVLIDNVYLGEAEQSEGPLFVLQWEPFHYIGGLHTIVVQAVVSIGVNSASIKRSLLSVCGYVCDVC